MFKSLLPFRLIIFIMVLGIATSCKKDEEPPAPPEPNTPALRSRIDYSLLTPTTPYNNPLFVDETGDSTVDRREGQTRLQMIRALDAYAKTSANAGTAILDSSVLENMFANKNSGFTGNYAHLNGSLLQVRNVTAASKSKAIADEVRGDFSSYFGHISNASDSVAKTASEGVAGKLFTATSGYLVDEKGIEWGQVIAKSLIGAFQLDYISNVLLDKGLEANNSYQVTGKNYTQLEHNWDEAYGILTLNPIYAGNATPTSNGGESFLGSYLWEYNKEGFPKIHPAFLKGRAAVVNNDINEARTQANIIRREMEKTLASAAIGYLGKWKTGQTDAARAHAIGEGAGFIYSLRFCKLNNADEAFSDNILNNLGLYTGNGFWDLTNDKVNAAISAIQTKFGL